MWLYIRVSSRPLHGDDQGLLTASLHSSRLASFLFSLYLSDINRDLYRGLTLLQLDVSDLAKCHGSVWLLLLQLCGVACLVVATSLAYRPNPSLPCNRSHRSRRLCRPRCGSTHASAGTRLTTVPGAGDAPLFSERSDTLLQQSAMPAAIVSGMRPPSRRPPHAAQDTNGSGGGGSSSSSDDAMLVAAAAVDSSCGVTTAAGDGSGSTDAVAAVTSTSTAASPSTTGVLLFLL